MTDFGGRVRQARESHGLTRLYVANAAGMDRSKYARIEEGEVEVKLGDAITLAKILGIPLMPESPDFELGVVFGLRLGAQILLVRAAERGGE